MPCRGDHLTGPGGALSAAAALWAAAFSWRRRVTWSVDLDLPVKLIAQPPGSPTALRVILEEHGTAAAPAPGEAAGWLVLVSVANTGLTPIRDRDFRAPLAFAFPGREVCNAQVSPAPDRPRPGHRPPVLPVPSPRQGAPGATHPSGVQLGGRVQLGRDDAFTLMVVLRSASAGTNLPVRQEGALTVGKISATRADAPPRGGSA